MPEWLTAVASLLIRSLAAGLANPVYWLAIWISYRRYKRQNPKRALDQTARSVIAGLVCGSAGMLFMCLAGLSVRLGPYLALLFPAALVLSRIRPRFCCFAYSGACIGIIGLMPGLGEFADTRGILMMVGVLHMMEAALVRTGAVSSREIVWKDGGLTGAIRQSGCWPVPFALLIPGSGPAGGVAMPAWWPLLGQDGSFQLFPMTTLMLYSADREKNYGVWRLFIYGAALLTVSLLLPEGALFQLAALAGMVLAHEWILLE